MSDVQFQPPVPPELPEARPEAVTPEPTSRDLAAFAWWTPFAAAAVGLMVTVVLVGLISLVYEATGGRISSDDPPPGILIGGTILQAFALTAAAVLFAGVAGERPTPAAFGLRRTRFWRALGLTAAFTFSFYLLSYVYFTVFNVTETDDLPSRFGAKDSTVNLVAVAFMVCMVAPLAEEIFFRGFLFPALSTVMGWVGGAIVSGCIFGAIHLTSADPSHIPPLMLLGVLLCVLYKLTGSILPCIALHAFNNGAALSLYMDFEAAGWALMLLGAPAACVAVALPLTRRLRPELA